MRWIDQRFREDPTHYVLQTLVAFAACAIIIIFLGALTNGAMVAALGASAFIVFAAPHSKMAKPRSLIGGHILSMGVGLLCSLVFRTGWVELTEVTAGWVGAGAVAVSLFGMVLTDSEHPPAAGNALAFAVSAFDMGHILFTLGAVAGLASIRHLLRRWLRNLI